MKIAIFSDTFYPQMNGVSHFALFSAKSLADRGHEVEVFTAISKKDLASLDFSNFKFKVRNIPSIPSPVYRKDHYRLVVPARWTRHYLKKFQPDIIHSHTPFALGLEAIFGAKKLGVPLVGEHHTFYDHYLKHVKMDFDWAKKASWKVTVSYYNRCDAVISPSRSLAESLSGYGLKKPVRVIPNSVDTDLFQPLSPEEKNRTKKEYGIDGPSIVYMGRVSYEKNIAQVVRIFFQLAKNNNLKDLKLMIIGDGPERNKLEELVKKLKLEKQVIFTGILKGSKLARALAANDVFVTASKSENMPLSVLESMSAGLPMAVASEKGLAEIVKDDHNGYLFSADNAGEAADKISRILLDENLQKKFSQNSRILAMDYSQEKVMYLFEKCYEELISNKQ